MPKTTDFADRLLNWWRIHGRHDLPWQHPRTPYRVWVAEVMLQQTRVDTVLRYFKRFIDRFPDLASLAGAELDEVLACWSGLGYYARARNLHRAAQLCLHEHGGTLPEDATQLKSLPGIGPSTAAAIRAQAFNRRGVILDGNVKRVMTRHAGIKGWPGRREVEKRLWSEAEARTPPRRAAEYTQAIMDLGAMVCVRGDPDCAHCPVAADCSARHDGRQLELPEPGPRRRLPQRRTRMWLLEDATHRILLVRRPPAGVWGGLWCLPESTQMEVATGEKLSADRLIKHIFTHFRLDITVEHRRVQTRPACRDNDHRWMEPARALDLGLPQPVRILLQDNLT